MGEAVHTETHQRPDLPDNGIGRQGHLPQTGDNSQQGIARKEQAQGTAEQIDVGHEQVAQLSAIQQVADPLLQVRPVLPQENQSPRQKCHQICQHRGPGRPYDPQFGRAPPAKDQRVIRSDIHQIGDHGDEHGSQGIGRAQEKPVQGDGGQRQGHAIDPHAEIALTPLLDLGTAAGQAEPHPGNQVPGQQHGEGQKQGDEQ